MSEIKEPSNEKVVKTREILELFRTSGENWSYDQLVQAIKGNKGYASIVEHMNFLNIIYSKRGTGFHFFF